MSLHLCEVQKKILITQKNNKMENLLELIGLTIFVLAAPLAIKYTVLYGISVFKK